jgi:DNA-binding NarL/FixJ family response regulator
MPSRPPGRTGHDEAVAALRGVLGESRIIQAWDEGERTLDDAVATVTRGRGPRGRPATGWESLTPTELDVARLVAGGLSNPEVAKRLYMSRSTVKTHLSHIYAKLDVTNRIQLAVAASTKIASGE